MVLNLTASQAMRLLRLYHFYTWLMDRDNHTVPDGFSHYKYDWWARQAGRISTAELYWGSYPLHDPDVVRFLLDLGGQHIRLLSRDGREMKEMPSDSPGMDRLVFLAADVDLLRLVTEQIAKFDPEPKFLRGIRSYADLGIREDAKDWSGSLVDNWWLDVREPLLRSLSAGSHKGSGQRWQEVSHYEPTVHPKR